MWYVHFVRDYKCSADNIQNYISDEVDALRYHEWSMYGSDSDFCQMSGCSCEKLRHHNRLFDPKCNFSHN